MSYEEEFCEELRERWIKAARGPVTLLDPLPRRVRARLWLTARINHLGYWLVVHPRPAPLRRRMW